MSLLAGAAKLSTKPRPRAPAQVSTHGQAGALPYVRVSSRAQDDDTQRSAIERSAAARGDTIGDWRAEKRSAKTLAREELQRLLADARAEKLKGRRLYVFRLDRLTRSGIADTLTTLAELRANGVEVVSVADGFDLKRGSFTTR